MPTVVDRSGVAPKSREYHPRGNLADVFRLRLPELLVSGPAGTGKSLALLMLIRYCCMEFPGCRWLMVRKTRESLTESALVTWEEEVLIDQLGEKVKMGPDRAGRKYYRFPNGSRVYVDGLRSSSKDNSQRVMSRAYDGIYVQEAIELAHDEWGQLTTRLRNKKMRVGGSYWHPLIADTNPSAPSHWLYKRCQEGHCKMVNTTHKDNPTLWDSKANKWTEEGTRYRDRLDRLPGVLRARLFDGLWVQAEGTVYEDWNPAIHLVDRFEVPVEWPRYWIIDFGYVHPFVWHEWVRDPDGRLYLHREIYRTKRTVDEHAKQIKEITEGDPAPAKIICDHDAEDRATFEKATGYRTSGAKKKVRPGIQKVQERLKPGADGRPRLFLMRDAVVERDRELDEERLPASTEEEFGSYIWNPNGTIPKDEPLKQYDHGMDAMRYMVAEFDLKSGFALR